MFTFTGINVNDTEGTATINVQEETSSYNSADLTVSKFPAAFQLGTLVVNPAEVSTGGVSTLSWSGSEGYNYAITPANLLTAPIDSSNNAGSVTTQPLSENTIFTLTVTSGSGDTAFVTTRTAGVSVDAPTVTSFTVNGQTAPTTSDLNASATFAWSTTNADHVLLMVDSSVVGFYPADNGSADVPIDYSGAYYIAAYYGDPSGGIHSPPSPSVQITLNPPRVVSLTSSLPNPIYADYKSVSLSWQTANATSAELQCGDQTGTFPVDVNAEDYEITPDATTNYTLYATYDPSEVSQALTTALMGTSTVQVETTSQKVTVSKAIQVTMDELHLDITVHTFKPGDDPWVRDLDYSSACTAVGISAFSYHFHNSDHHNLQQIQMSATSSLSGDGKTLTVTPTMILNDKSSSGHYIGNTATLSVMSISIYNTYCNGVYAETVETVSGDPDYSLPNDDPEQTVSILGGFLVNCSSDVDSQISDLSASVDQPTNIIPNTAEGTTSLTSSSSASASGDETYESSLWLTLLERRDVPEGTGIGIKYLSTQKPSVTFDQPVKNAYTVLSSWIDDGNGNTHTIKQLRSDYVSPTCNGSATVTLDWGSAFWSNDTHTWDAVREIIVIACYENHR